MIFCIEKHYLFRRSSIPDYYKMGNKIPGLRIDGMNVLALREGVRFAKEYCGVGNGPIYLEMMTSPQYTSVRFADWVTEEEMVRFHRRHLDPLRQIIDRLKEVGFMTPQQIREMEDRISTKLGWKWISASARYFNSKL